MARRSRKSDCQPPKEAHRPILPAGTPTWISAELVEMTLKTWQPYYRKLLTIDDAIGIIRDTSLIFQIL